MKMLSADSLEGGYGGRSVLQDISFEVKQGELFGILGPNGSGKTTLLKMLSGIIKAQKGRIEIKGKNLNEYSAKELARIVAVLPQHYDQSFAYSVKETVSLGRYAHQRGWLQSWNEKDEEIVQKAMADTGVDSFENRYIQELSGGERQRVFLAQALAQEPEILLLDEPTNHLDLSFQKELLDLLRKWTSQGGLTVISIFHDLNLAALYCDKLLLMEKGKMDLLSVPHHVLQEQRISRVYKTEILKQSHPALDKPQMVIMPERAAGNDSCYKMSREFLHTEPGVVEFQSPIPLKTVSTEHGISWYSRFLMKTEHTHDGSLEVGSGTYWSSTNADRLNVSTGRTQDDSVFAVMIHSTGEHREQRGIWVFIDAALSEAAMIECVAVCADAQARAHSGNGTQDPHTEILVASTQKGKEIKERKQITSLKELVADSIQSCLLEL
ncbi:heme ABC transporter ATP-binding protein [Bacillus sp. OV322]|uniref:heme ABC transporter ATP-binding protein n=1 Tax=Bacillus sp. OV322 TaxID=1882764 RepID=UPI00210A2009|nr:heme ABC transporter ATP-binding protein [Bacillus sp. OV322]